MTDEERLYAIDYLREELTNLMAGLTAKGEKEEVLAEDVLDPEPKSDDVAD